MYRNQTVYKNLLAKMDNKTNYSVSHIATYPLRCTWKCIRLMFYLTLFIFGIVTLGLVVYLSVKVTTFLSPVSGIISGVTSDGTSCIMNPSFGSCLGFMFPVPVKIGKSIASVMSPSPRPTTFSFKNVILKEREIFLYYKSECNKTFDIAQYDSFSHNDTCCFAGPLVTETSMNWDFILFCSWSGKMEEITACPCDDSEPTPQPSTTVALPRSRRTRNKLLHSLLVDPSDGGS